MTISNVTNALDLKGLADVKLQARAGSAEGTRKAAREFEAMFLNMMLKGMRDSLSHDDPLESDATRMATSMRDGQLAQSMAAKGLGLADAIVKQIERSQTTVKPSSTPSQVEPIPLNGHEPAPIPLRHGFLLDNAGTQLKPGPPAIEATGAQSKDWTLRGLRSGSRSQRFKEPKDFANPVKSRAAAQQRVGTTEFCGYAPPGGGGSFARQRHSNQGHFGTGGPGERLGKA